MSSANKPQQRNASIKETGEELPQDQWERFEAAVDDLKADPVPGEKPAGRQGDDATGSRKKLPDR